MKKIRYRFLFRRQLVFIRPALLFLFSFGLVFFGFKFVAKDTRFNIKTYKYSGIVKYVSEPDFVKIVDAHVLGKNIFTFDTVNLEDSLKNSFLGIKNVKVRKHLLNSLEIQVQERTPVAIVIDVNNLPFLIDSDGYVLGQSGSEIKELPSISYEKNLIVGEFIDKEMLPLALELINQAKIDNVAVSSLSYKPDYAEFYVKQQILVEVNKKRNVKEIFRIISKLIEDSAKLGKELAKIDLRYDKVIVSYK